jgi:hypothetical protein
VIAGLTYNVVPFGSAPIIQPLNATDYTYAKLVGCAELIPFFGTQDVGSFLLGIDFYGTPFSTTGWITFFLTDGVSTPGDNTGRSVILRTFNLADVYNDEAASPGQGVLSQYTFTQLVDISNVLASTIPDASLWVGVQYGDLNPAALGGSVAVGAIGVQPGLLNIVPPP